MQVGSKQYGVPVPGTCLLQHGRAPRLSASNRHSNRWFECTCGTFKMIRVASVASGRTVSCGCKGADHFDRYHTQRAANLSEPKQNQIFSLAHKRNRKKRFTAYEIAAKFRISKYVVDFVCAAKCAALRALAGTRDALRKGLSWIEQQWIQRYQLSVRGKAYDSARKAFLDGLHWRDREVWLAAEKAKFYTGPVTDAIRAVMSGESDAAVEFEFVA